MGGMGMGMDMGMDGPSMMGPGFGRGMGPRGGMGRGGLLDPHGMGMGDGGMEFGSGYGPMGNEGPGFGSFRDQLLEMGGGGPIGPGGGLMKRFKAFRPDPAMQGRRLQIEGLPDEVEDSAVTRYFQRFGALGGFGEEGWNRAKGHITYKESSMADYALKKKSHTIEGHLVTIVKAEPEPEPPGEEEEDLPEPEEDEHGMTMIKKMKMSLDGEEAGEMSPDEAATRAKMKEAGYSEEEIQTMI